MTQTSSDVENHYLRKRIRNLEASIANMRESIAIMNSSADETHGRLENWVERVHQARSDASLELLAERERYAALLADRDALERERIALHAVRENLELQIAVMKASNFWRLRNAWMRIRGKS
jgi:hypothetical protein